MLRFYVDNQADYFCYLRLILKLMCYHLKYHFFMIILLFFMLYENDTVKKKKNHINLVVMDMMKSAVALLFNSLLN